MVAVSPGQVDLVLYSANSGLNPNVAFTNQIGHPNDHCIKPGPMTNSDSIITACYANTTVWNTYFGQSQNALNN